MPLSSPFPLLDIRKVSEMKEEEDRGRWWFGFSGREIKKIAQCPIELRGKSCAKIGRIREMEDEDEAILFLP